MILCIILMALSALTLVFYLIEKIKKYSVKSVLIKFVVSLLFVSVAVVSTYVKGGTILNPFIIIGLLLGLSGDIWLDLKYVHPQDNKIYTYAGFIVFGLGHILYITGMFIQFLNGNSILYIIIPILVAILIGIINLFLEKPMKLKFGEMKLIVFIYSICLFSLPASALSLLISCGFNNTTLMMILIGGVLFAISDLVLSNTYFGENHELPLDFILNYLTYYPAQFLIAFSLFFL